MIGSKVWFLVPARGGSKGVPRKNLRRLADSPLIEYVLRTIGSFAKKEEIIVSTDDELIAQVSSKYASALKRPVALAADRATLDDVAFSVAEHLVQVGADLNDILITVQPTSPLIRASSLQRAIHLLDEGARCVVSVRDDRHLRWTIKQGTPRPMFEARVNRQWLPPTFSETGGVIAVRLGDLLETGTRIQSSAALLELDEVEGLDIDTHADWALAEFYLSRKRIVIRADAAPMLGMGHVHRALALAYELANHQPVLATRADGDYRLGADFLRKHPYQIVELQNEEQFFDLLERQMPDITILDVLDTEDTYVHRVHQLTGFVVSLEDLGSGSRFADVVINDLYDDIYPQKNHWYGVKHALLSPNFEMDTAPPEARVAVEHILVTFGGTDPENLTTKALQALSNVGFSGEVTVVLGTGYRHGEIDLFDYGLQGRVVRSVKNMAQVMRQHDMALTSAGRTVTELMTLGIPTLVMCQNMRELRHTHASSPYGVINLGLGKHVEVPALAEYIDTLLSDDTLRADMRKRALSAVRERSNHAVVQRILAAADVPQMGKSPS